MLAVILLGAAAFVGLALLLGGTLRAEAVLAVANLVWLVFVAIGGVIVPLDQAPAGAAGHRRAHPAGRDVAGAAGRRWTASAPSAGCMLVLAGLGRDRLGRDRTVVPMAINTPTGTERPRTRRSWWRRAPSHQLQKAFAWAAVITNGMIAVTGATVRVTGSGLGCPTWPECHPGSLIPVSRADLSPIHQAIEFGNRTLTGLVLIASLGLFLVLWRARPRRPALVRLSAVLPAGVLFQAVWGG